MSNKFKLEAEKSRIETHRDALKRWTGGAESAARGDRLGAGSASREGRRPGRRDRPATAPARGGEQPLGRPRGDRGVRRGGEVPHRASRESPAIADLAASLVVDHWEPTRGR